MNTDDTEKLKRVQEEFLKEIRQKKPHFFNMIVEYTSLPSKNIKTKILFHREQAHMELDKNLDEVEKIVSEIYHRLVNDPNI